MITYDKNRAINLAKYIIQRCNITNTPITNLKLQKILYYVQKYSLKTSGTSAFSDDIEAWQFGPVVPNVYYEFCGYGSMPIIGNFKHIDDFSEFNFIIDEKKDLNPWDMVEETHKENGAWYKIYNNGIGNREIIPVDLIKKCG